jgi:hypothetical protein
VAGAMLRGMPWLVVFLVRLLARPVATRLVSQEGASAAARLIVAGKVMQERLATSEESDEELSAALSELTGTLVNVATFTGSFETRRIQANWSINSNDVRGEDVRVATFHLLKVSGGNPVASWDAADFDAANARFRTWWLALRGWHQSTLKLLELRYYREGPGIEPPQPPVHVYGVPSGDQAGSSSSSVVMPPQVAITVTEKAGTHKHWGRFYYPAVAAVGPASMDAITVYGRVHTNLLSALANATDTLYEGLKADGLVPVVYRAPLPQRQTKKGATLAPRAASAWTVDDIQVDDLFDVVRSRRFAQPLLKVQREIA